MTWGDTNAFLGSAPAIVAWMAGLLVFISGLGIVSWLSSSMLGLARYGVIVYLGLVLVGCLITFVFGPFFLGTDGPQYDLQAFGYAEKLHGSGAGIGLTVGKEGWPVILGSVYFLLGRVTFVGILLNCIAVGISAVFVAKTSSLIWGSFSSRALYLWYFFTPLFLLLGPSLMREALCWMAISMVCFGSVSAAKNGVQDIWIAVGGIVVLLAVRTSLAVLVVGALALAWLVITLFSKRMYVTLLILVVVGLGSASALLGIVLQNLGFSEEGIQSNRAYISADATTGFVTNSLQAGLLGFLWTAAQVFPRVLLGPFVWELGASAVWFWVGLNSIAWLTLLAITVRRTLRNLNRDWNLIFFLAVGLLLLFMSLSLTNYGIVVRMRGAAIIMLLPIALRGGQGVAPSRRSTTPKAIRVSPPQPRLTGEGGSRMFAAWPEEDESSGLRRTRRAQGDKPSQGQAHDLERITGRDEHFKPKPTGN